MNSDSEEVTSDGKPFHIRAPATGKARRPDSRNEQTVGDWGPESVPRRNVGGVHLQTYVHVARKSVSHAMLRQTETKHKQVHQLHVEIKIFGVQLIMKSCWTMALKAKLRPPRDHGQDYSETVLEDFIQAIWSIIQD